MMRRAGLLLSLAIVLSTTLALAAQMGAGRNGHTGKVELPLPFYWAAPDLLRGDWQGQGGYVAQIVPVMDRIFSVENLIPQQDDAGKYEAHLFRQFDVPNDKPVAVLTGTLQDGMLEFQGNAWSGSIDMGHFKAQNGNNSVPEKPGIRASRPVLEWQTFDIDFKAPRFDAPGHKTADAVVSLRLNGVPMYTDQHLGPVILNAAKLGEAPKGPIQLQEHGMPVQFRNIWWSTRVNRPAQLWWKAGA